MRNIFIYLLTILFSYNAIAQGCSAVPVVEAVRNGDFENGYLPNGGATDFYSDMDFGGNTFSSQAGGCNYGMADQYVVARRDTFRCASTDYVDNTHWGISYGGDAVFADHTPGKNGDGYALLVDLNARTVSPKTGGRPIAWEQTVDVYPSESYFFSAWIANFSSGTAPQMQVTFIPENGGVVDNGGIQTVSANGSTAGLMNWSQMDAEWIPAGVYDRVTIRFEFVNVAGGNGGLDVAIDDISFINSCQNISGDNNYIADFGLPDTVSICGTDGDLLLDPGAPVLQRGNATVTWYEGTGNPQTQTSTGNWTQTIDQPGLYRVCIDDPDNGCPVSDQIVVTDDFEVTLEDAEICNPSTVVLDAEVEPNTGTPLNYNWTVPGGSNNTSSNNQFTADIEGNYSIQVTGPTYNGGSCVTTDNATVSKNMAGTINVADIELCNPSQFPFVADDFLTWASPNINYRWTTWSGSGANPGEQASNLVSTIDQAGSYTVEIFDANAPTCNASSTFNVTSNVPVLDTIEICEGGGTAVNVSASDGLSYYWSEVNSMSPLLAQGNSFVWNVPIGYDGSPLYVQSTATTPLNPSLGPNANGGYLTNDPVTITVNEPSFFTSFRVSMNTNGPCGWPNPPNAPYVFNLNGPGVSDVFNIDVNCGGVTTINVNRVLSPGTYTLTSDQPLLNAGFGNIGNTSTSGNEVVISVGGSLINFGNMIFESSQACEPTAVPVKEITCCTPPTDDVTIDQPASTLEICLPGTGELVSSALTNGLDYRWQVSYDDMSTWTEWGGAGTSTGTVAGGSVTLSNIDSTAHYRLVIAESGNINASCVKYSDSVFVKIKPNPEIDVADITIDPNETEFCVGEVYDLTALATLSVDTPITYQWKLDGTSNTDEQVGITTAGTYDYRVVATADGCSDSAEVQIEVLPFDTIVFTNDTVGVCNSENPFDLTQFIDAGNSSYTGGTWSGTGVTGNDFDPNGLDGFYQITFATNGDCPFTDSLVIAVVNQITLSFNIADYEVCADAPVDSMSKYVNSFGGDFWGYGIDDTDADAVQFGIFDPSQNIGTGILYYGIPGDCGDTSQINLTVNPLDTIAFTEDTIGLCNSAPAFDLTQYIDAGNSDYNAGTWSGTGVTGDDFDPAGLDGFYTVRFLTDGACAFEDSMVINVTNQITLSFNPAVSGTIDGVCADLDPVVISGIPSFANVSGGQFWGFGIDHTVDTDSTQGYFDASSVTPGTGDLFYGIAGECGDTISVSITINPLDTAAVIDPPNFCDSDPITTLSLDSAVSTLGGTWTDGAGNNTYIDANGNFNPSGLAQGTYDVIYNTPGSCSYSDTNQVEIVNFVNYNITTATDAGETFKSFCITDGVEAIQVNINGGVYWTTSGDGFANTNSSDFDPSGMTVGTDTIWYGKAGDCGDTTFLPIEILPMDTAAIAISIDAVTGTRDTAVCADDAAFNIGLSGNTTTGGVWSGSGITDAVAGTFDPSTVGAGTYEIVYLTDGGGTRCDVSDTAYIEVRPRSDASFNVNAFAFCGSDGAEEFTVAEAGGTFTSNLWGNPGDGAYTIVDATTIEFDPTTSGAGLDTIFYTIGGLCGAQDTLQIGVSADDVADIEAAGPFCQTDASTQLTVTALSTAGGDWTDGDGNDVGTYINATGMFDPSSATVGMNEVIYNTTGICPVSDTIEVEVVSEIIAEIDEQDGLGNPIDTIYVCEDDASFMINLTAQTTGGGVWRTEPAGLLNASDEVDPSLGTPGDVYKALYAAYGGTATCSDSDSVYIHIYPRLDATISSFGAVGAGGQGVDRDTLICENSDPFTVRALNAGGTWRGAAGSNYIDATTGQFDPAGLSGGSYEVIYRQTDIRDLCPDEDTVYVNIRPQVTVSFGSTMNDICQFSDEFDLSDTYDVSPDSGVWFFNPANPNLTISDANAGTINPDTEGSYTIYYGVDDLCGDTNVVNFDIIEVPDPAITDVPSGAVCIGDDTYAFDHAVATSTGGEWSINGGGTIDAATGEVNLELTGAGTYTVTYGYTAANNNGCPVDSTAEIVIEDYLIASIDPIGPFCENLGPQALSVTGEQGGTWGGAASLDGNFRPQFYGQGTHTVSYRLQNACDTTFFRDIEVEGVPFTDYTIYNPNPTNCEPLTFSFVDASTAATNSTRWTLSNGEEFVITNSDTAEVTLMAGTYYAGMIQEYANGCRDTLALDLGNGFIDVEAQPTPDFIWEPNPASADDPNIQFENLSQDASMYDWQFDSRGNATPAVSNEFSPYVRFDTPDGDTIEVCLTAINGSCVADTCKDVQIMNNLTVFMPNAFSPNDDGLNDVFFPAGKFHDNPFDTDQYEFLIFNRWGEVIFESRTPYEGWDGTFRRNGNQVQQDVYVWRLTVYDPKQKQPKVLYGSVTVIIN